MYLLSANIILGRSSLATGKGGESMSTDVPGVDKTSGWRSLGGGSLLVAEAICDTVH